MIYLHVTIYITISIYRGSTSFHDAYICLRHAHYRYQPQLPYKSHRTYSTNRMGSISHHITPLVIDSLGGGHTHTHTQTRIQKFADRSNSKKPGAPGLKTNSYSSCTLDRFLCLIYCNYHDSDRFHSIIRLQKLCFNLLKLNANKHKYVSSLVNDSP